jgi:hypothetical protein
MNTFLSSLEREAGLSIQLYNNFLNFFITTVSRPALELMQTPTLTLAVTTVTEKLNSSHHN